MEIFVAYALSVVGQGVAMYSAGQKFRTFNAMDFL